MMISEDEVTKSSSTGAQYVAQQKKIWMKKSQNMPVCLGKWFWPNIFPQDAEAVKRHSGV